MSQAQRDGGLSTTRLTAVDNSGDDTLKCSEVFVNLFADELADSFVGHQSTKG